MRSPPPGGGAGLAAPPAAPAGQAVGPGGEQGSHLVEVLPLLQPLSGRPLLRGWRGGLNPLLRRPVGGVGLVRRSIPAPGLSVRSRSPRGLLPSLLSRGRAFASLPPAVGQGQLRRRVEILQVDVSAPGQGGQGAGGVQDGQLRPVPGGVGLPGQQAGGLLLRLPHVHLGQQGAGGGQLPGQPLLPPGPLGAKGGGVFLKGQAAAHHLFPGLRLPLPRYRHIEAKAVQQLGAERPLLRIHGAHQGEAGGAGVGDAVPLHPAHSGLQRVQQGGGQGGGEQIYLVGIEYRPVGPGQQTGLEGSAAGAHRRLQLHTAQQHVLRGAYRQLQQAHSVQAAQGPHQSGLGRPLFPAQQHPADAGLHRQAEEGLLCPLLPHHGGERIQGPIHRTAPPSRCRHLQPAQTGPGAGGGAGPVPPPAAAPPFRPPSGPPEPPEPVPS